MQQSTIVQYTINFKRQVVDEIEAGRFHSLEQARMHYGIGGSCTIQKWIRRFAKNQLLPKVVVVKQINEADMISTLRQQVAQLQKALGQTQAENLLNAEYLKMACESMGQDVEAFKKKSAGTPSAESKNAAK
jgi:transposase